MGSTLKSIEPEVMIFNNLYFDTSNPMGLVIIKGHDIHDQTLNKELIEWVFNPKTVPLLSLQDLKSGDLLFWHSGELVPVTYDTNDSKLTVFRKLSN